MGSEGPGSSHTKGSPLRSQREGGTRIPPVQHAGDLGAG